MPLDETYFVWLYSQVGSVENRNRSRTYWTLLRLLYKKEFTWSDIEMDENRAQDGKDLRRRFVAEENVTVDEPGWLEMECSMLELLISLSEKLEWESDDLSSSEWFWKIIDNLGLTECTDAHPPEEDIVEYILDKVIERDYSPNGAGGLFPLRNSNEDQREVELWYQAQAFLLERI